MQQRTARVLKEHELDLVRSFRTRLLDVQRELHMERSRQDEAALEWIERAQSLTKKLDWAKEEALRLDGLNQILTRENNRLRTQFQAQEGDREHMVAQVVALRRELKTTSEKLAMAEEQLQAHVNESHDEQHAADPYMMETTRSLPSRGGPRTPAPGLGRSLQSRGSMLSSGPRRASLDMLEPSAALGEAALKEVDRWKEEVRRLRKVLETERKNLRKARGAYVASVSERTELQSFLRQAITDVQVRFLSCLFFVQFWLTL